jgi:lipopolysaccharide biosynthesis regulator YciM
MNFDLQWLLLGLPIAFALGWLGSRLDLRQWKREQTSSPKAYFKGLNLLLNEQQDKAIDAFIEAVQHDPDTSDLHFALGNLFRRRGEYERAVRVHQHLVSRADLPRAERDRAQHALAQDFMKAGLFDRAEEAYKALEGTAFATEAQLALLTLHERSRDWRAAVEVAQKLERSGTASFASRIAHYWCELAQEADARKQDDEAEEALRQARDASPQTARPLVLAGQRAAARGEHAQALVLWGELLAKHPAAFNLVSREYAASAAATGDTPAALDWLQSLYRRSPTMDLLAAIATLDPAPAAQRARLLAHLQEQPTLSAAQELLRQSANDKLALDANEAQSLRTAVSRAAKPLQRYRCAACGFEAQHYFWQCPGCLSWDSYPPQRLEDL